MLLSLAECVFRGLFDSLKAFTVAFQFLVKSSTLRWLIMKCFVLNGVLFIGSVLVWDHVVKRLLQYLVVDKNVLHFTEYLSKFLYYLFWVWPIYAVSFLLSSLWYQDIAKHLSKLVRSDVKSHGPQPSLSTVIGRELYRTILFSIYLIQSSMLYYLNPLGLGRPMSFVFASWLYSFYCFEYVWIRMGWSLERRLKFFEERWAYFLGFGLPCTLITFWFPQMIGSGLFALVFPVFEIACFTVVPQPINISDSIRLPVFSLCATLTVLFVRMFRQKGYKR